MPDSYNEQATTLEPDDAPDLNRLDESESLPNKYQRFKTWNTLRWNGKWLDESGETQRSAQAIIDAVASSLELTPYQKERAKQHFDDLPDNFVQAYSTGLLALCVCGIAGNADGREYHPKRHPETGVEPVPANEFAALAKDLDVRYGKLASCWGRIRRVLE